MVRARIALVLVGLLVGCTEFAPRADVSDVSTPGQDWSCLDAPSTARRGIVPDDTRVVNYSVRFATLFGGQPTNVRVRACSPADVTCASPVAQELRPDSQGIVTLPLFWGFDGFLEVTADGMVPAAFSMRGALVESAVDPLPMVMVPLAGVSQLAASNGVAFRDDQALVLLEVVDCQGVLAGGVRFANDSGGLPFYMENGLPNTLASLTDERGVGGFINAPTGVVRVSGFVGQTERLIATKTLNFRAGWANVEMITSPGFQL
jgi:hypothetical protein